MLHLSISNTKLYQIQHTTLHIGQWLTECKPMLYSCTFECHALHLGFSNYASIVAHVYKVQYRANMKLVYSQGYTCMGNCPTKPRRFGKPQSAASQHFVIQSDTAEEALETPHSLLQDYSNTARVKPAPAPGHAASSAPLRYAVPTPYRTGWKSPGAAACEDPGAAPAGCACCRPPTGAACGWPQAPGPAPKAAAG